MMSISQKDKDLLRGLATRVAEIAELPIQKERADLWNRLNSLERVRPLVNWHMEDMCWPEVLPDDVLECVNDVCRNYEKHLRRIIYQWDNIKDDKVVTAEIPYPVVINDKGFGLTADISHSGFVHGGAVAFKAVLEEESDIEKIKIPIITIDQAATDRSYQLCSEIFDGILKPVRKNSFAFPFISLADDFATFRGVEQMYMDFIDRPKWVHKVFERMLQARLSAFEQYEKLGLLNLNNSNNEVGTSALGYIDELPEDNFDNEHIRLKDVWGFSTSQVFVSVSNNMYEEFATQYDRRFFSRVGLGVIGCCEPLERRMNFIRTIPNIRIISMSEWVDRDRAAEELKDDYVFAYKPTGTYFAAESWNLETARKDLEDLLIKTRDCVVEIHHNACSTCRNQPERIIQWVDMAMDLAEQYA
jgi:hypothetical protein